ncbi:hypothetical protein M422DRAFT_35866 [Sphaerobolus stellatus SS14]|uniref:Mediator of RNA polymerase II transcription subunit 13 n=1 Tax=Sphaerobolus stellatus (strain SS14) TaxID=990650 RepID=A0A0C9TQC8_SPHS4|nr:hypothetical protein M422DRAFT_35866 [Sphaerobolus stellatus SS14]
MTSSGRCSSLPRQITEDSKVLLGNIPLPPHPSITFAKFIPFSDEQQPHRIIDLARQSIVNDARQYDKKIVESLLPVVSVGKDETALWVFSIRSYHDIISQDTHTKGKDREDISYSRDLQELYLDGLQCSPLSFFTPSSLYPCSIECAQLPSPCPACCANPPASTFSAGNASLGSATVCPRKSIRHIFSLFLDAIRDRLIDDICAPRQNVQNPGLKRMSKATRLGHGFLSSPDYAHSLWGHGWDRRSQTQPLIHTAVGISLTPTYIRVRPLPTVTNLLPIPFQSSSTSAPTTPGSSSTPACSPTLVPGIPLVLAPYPTPAFYVSMHLASSIPSSLRIQFWEALSGLGASCPQTTHIPSTSSSSSKKLFDSSEFYLLVYIPIINPQGENKGVAALWPSHLAFIDTGPSRVHLTTLPELSGIEGLLTPPRNMGASRSNEPALLYSTAPTTTRSRPSLRSSVHRLSRTLRSFRALELVGQKRIPGTPVVGTARRTAGFVESVAKEREKERERANLERLRRERELREGRTPSASSLAGSSSQLANVAAPSPAGEPPKVQAASSNVSTEPPRPASSWHSISSTFFAKAAQDNLNNSFYPSPPDWNPSSSAVEMAPSSSAIIPSIPPPAPSISGPQVPQTASTTNQPIRGLDMSSGMDLGMDIDMNDIGMNLGHSMNVMDVNMDATGLLDSGFGNYDAFTDDDFNYFDTVPVTQVVPDLSEPLTTLGVSTDMDNWLTSGLDGAHETPQIQTITPPSGDMSAPIMVDGRDGMPPAPDLIPSSPAKTPSSVGNPATPSIDFNMPPPSSGRYMFEPIDFGDRHHLADEKYTDAGGKFALAQIMPRSDQVESLLPGFEIEKEDGWKVRYDAATDPRIGVINRLRGIKRKQDDKPFSSRIIQGRLRDEEWANTSHIPISVPTPVSPAAALGSASERNKTLELLAQAMAKEVVENELWSQAWGSSSGSKMMSNPAALRYRISQTELNYILGLVKRVSDIEVPLPVSVLFEERSSTVAQPSTPAPSTGKLQLLQQPKFNIGRAGLVQQVLPSAVRFWEKEGLGPRNGTKNVIAFALFEGEDRKPLIKDWLDKVGRAYTTRGLGIHNPGNVDPFEEGLVPVQFDTVRKTLPNLLAALPPEPQHIVIYVIAPPTLCSSLESPALRTIIRSQKCVPKLGGQHEFDQNRVLIHFVPEYCVEDPNIYPSSRHVGLESFVTSVYDRLLRVAVRQTSRQFWEFSPTFENRFQVPAFTLARSLLPQTQLQWDEKPSLNVLDRHTFLHVGYRLSDCKRWLLAACIDERGEAHDVAVWGIPNFDSQSSAIHWMVFKIWIFVKQFAQRADTEWRIVIAKLGEITEMEVEAWTSHLETMVSTNTGPPLHVSLVCAQNDIPLPFLDPEKKASPHPSPTGLTTVFADVSSVTYSAAFSQRLPIVSSGLLCPWEYPSFLSPFGAGEDDGDSHISPIVPVGVLPLATTALLRVSNKMDVDPLYIHLIYANKSSKSTLKKTLHEVHADITRSWHDLGILTRDRWHLPQDGLPFHLAALNTMSRALDPELLLPDAKDME